MVGQVKKTVLGCKLIGLLNNDPLKFRDI